MILASDDHFFTPLERKIIEYDRGQNKKADEIPADSQSMDGHTSKTFGSPILP
jgi:hypothetical protein